MKYLLIALIVIVAILIIYIILIKKEIKRVSKEIDTIRTNDSNNLVHSNFETKEIYMLSQKINFLLSEIKETKQEYARKNSELMKMITNISHDLRTPLTSAIGYIDIIRTSDLSKEEQEKELKTIENRLRKLENLINSFFEFSKTVSNDERPVIEKTNLNMAIENCIANYYEDFEKKNRKIVLSAFNNKIMINSNKKLLTRIFDNLIGNAFKHSSSDLEINIESIESDKNVKIDTNASKIRISFINNLLYTDLDTEKIFDEFYTVDMSRTKENTGLGLAIAKEFTEQLNGKIYAEKSNGNLRIIIEF